MRVSCESANQYPHLLCFAQRYIVDPRRLLESIVYEAEVRQQFSQPVIELQEHFYPVGVMGEREDLSVDLKNTACELSTLDRIVLFALKREQYYNDHGEYDYLTKRGIESGLIEGAMACAG